MARLKPRPFKSLDRQSQRWKRCATQRLKVHAVRTLAGEWRPCDLVYGAAGT